MKTTTQFALCCILLLGLQSCHNSFEKQKGTVGFVIDYQNDTTIITVRSPWQRGTTMAQYHLTQPYQRIACTSATHVGFLRELGLMDRVVGVCHPERIYNLTAEQRATLIDLGDDMNPNLEKFLLSQPDAIVVSTYAEGDAATAKIATLGIPVLYCNEWTESSPLARAEWIRFFGACFGHLALADSIYNSVKQAYNREVTEVSGHSPYILSGQSFRGTWYVPSGNTYMGHLFQDAGYNYLYQSKTEAQSIPLTIEQALQDFSDADVWVGCNAYSLKELAAIDNTHTWFKAYQNGNVYNFYHRTLPSGANDFWETGVVHPERILHDLRLIEHSVTSENNVVLSVNPTSSLQSDTLFFAEKLR